LTDAAAVLGISENALRLRIRRHQVNAHKRGGRWYVVIDQVADQSVTTPIDQSETVAALRETVEILQADVAYLRDQLDQRSHELAAERERADVISQLALQRIPPLSAGLSNDWKDEPRPEPPTASPEAQGEAETPKGQSDTLTNRRSWWRRLLRM